jgi:hypothetical protein
VWQGEPGSGLKEDDSKGSEGSEDPEGPDVVDYNQLPTQWGSEYDIELIRTFFTDELD